MKTATQLRTEILKSLNKYDCFKKSDVIDFILDYEDEIFSISGLEVSQYFNIELKKFI